MNITDDKHETFPARAGCVFSAAIRLVIAAIAAAPAVALAQGQPPFVWAPSPYQYDIGAAPAVAMAGTFVVEVHQSVDGFGPLYYHTGRIQQNGTVAWASSAVQYDNYGGSPSVALTGTSVIEVHEIYVYPNSIGLAYRTGKIHSDGTIAWTGKAHSYCCAYEYSAYAPFVSVAGTTIVEVHQTTEGSGQLRYYTAELETDGTVEWDPNALPYGTGGMQPSVALAGSTMLEVYRAGTGIGLFYYGAGEIQANGTLQLAANQYSYDMGYQPSVAASGPTIVEVHQGGTGVGPLYYHTGGLQSDGTVQFAPDSFTYDTGIMPRVAVSGGTILEVHQVGTGVGPLYYHTAAY